MLPHSLSNEYGDRSSVVALDFGDPAMGRPPRVVVSHGDSATSWRVGYEYHGTEVSHGYRFNRWRRFEVGQMWHTNVARAAREGGRDLGACQDFDSLMIRPDGPGLGPFASWLRTECERLDALHAAMRSEAAAIEPVGGRFTREQQERLAALRFDADLTTKLTVIAASPGLLRVVGDWLLRLRGKLMHGADLFELADHHRVALHGGAEIDQLIGPIMAIRLVAPYTYEPRPGTRTFETAGQLSKAQQIAWSQQGQTPATMQQPHVFGTAFWTYRAGPRLRSVPHYSL